ncbi:hypothetical protein CMV_012701 [Castanea mollissima]|uniref:Uncharacterized protein n=1 Tax=Castanea mollissima TaxID=60419 RepID=A0A8J4RF32_9ROSI|nr:hypothetical protein CMV_012701 [Castanea mollissima]
MKYFILIQIRPKDKKAPNPKWAADADPDPDPAVSRGPHTFKTQEPNSNAYISKYHRFPRAQNLEQNKKKIRLRSYKTHRSFSPLSVTGARYAEGGRDTCHLLVAVAAQLSSNQNLRV